PEDRPVAAEAQAVRSGAAAPRVAGGRGRGASDLAIPAYTRQFGPPMPFREHYLFVCTNRRPDGHPKGSCAQKGSEDVLAKLKDVLARRGAAKEAVRACGSSCLDMCESGITVLQEPEHAAYGGVTAADVDELADAAIRGGVVDRLLQHGGRRAG
ncbi:MAG TPA: (2Fe-2S) ferredoxin domain-containing protein, partial [Polyangiaceae bacterium]|nr:(2Fe-2S) ferredoxin domain-containing protein [Polyangiaceae bacterium]